MAQAQVHRDTDYLATGTHKGASAVMVLHDPGADFLSCGVSVGLAIYNDDDESNGLVTVVSESSVTCTLAGGTNNYWSSGDTYYIYKTSAYNTKISTIYTDRRAGHKVTEKSQLTDEGYLPEDVDLDQDDDNVFGPGQPIKRYRG